jgi:hypothetical protein
MRGGALIGSQDPAALRRIRDIGQRGGGFSWVDWHAGIRLVDALYSVL